VLPLVASRDGEYSVDVMFFVEGTSIAGLQVKKSDGLMWIWCISTGLFFCQFLTRKDVARGD
jgi:hypothetical protein